MKRKSRIPTLAQNQNSAIRMVCSIGTMPETTKIAAIPRNTSAVTGSEYLSLGRAGFSPAYRATSPPSTNTIGAIQLDHGAGNSGVQPPRNSSVATQVTVIMLQYSAMKNDAN